MTEAARWFLYLDDKTYGPFTREQIHAVLEVKRADAETPACADGEETWLPLADTLPDLFDLPLEALQPEETESELQLEAAPEAGSRDAPPPLPVSSLPVSSRTSSAPAPAPGRQTRVTKKFQAPGATSAPPPPPGRKAVTPNEVAAYFGVNAIEVLHWIRDGHLQARKVPGRGDPVIEVAAIAAFCTATRRPVPKGLRVSGHRVLVIEHDADTARTLSGRLQSEGFETFVARDGFVGGAALESFRPHVVTVDPLMPGMAGNEAVRFIHDKSRHLGTRILVVSNLSEKQQDEALRFGADAVLPKPVAFDALMEKIRALVAPR